VSRRDVVDLDDVRAERRDACLVFELIVHDAGSSSGRGNFLWKWTTRENRDEWRPSTAQLARQLRRIAARMDPQPVAPVTRRRHRVRSA
jgi:hypothetical protein